MTKGHEHEIVRALKTHPKAHHGKLILYFVWSWAFNCSVICDLGSQWNSQLRVLVLIGIMVYLECSIVGIYVKSKLLRCSLCDQE
jgi:hypothetical protein